MLVYPYPRLSLKAARQKRDEQKQIQLAAHRFQQLPAHRQGMRITLLPHTQVRFEVEGGRVMIEKEAPEGSPGKEGFQRLRRARLPTRLSTDALLALTRGDEQL